MRLGIDVSDNQGYIDWQKVGAAGVQFAIMRTTRHSGNPDTHLASNINGCRNAGIPFDFYKYSYAVSEPEAQKEALGAVSAMKGYGVKGGKETILYMDVEDSVQFALSTAKLTGIVKAFKETVETLGFSFGLYMGKHYYEAGEVDLSAFDDLTWIARYYNGYNPMDFGTVPNEKYRPAVKSGRMMGWQFTSSGKVPGISGNVDLDVYYGEIAQSVIEPQYYATPEFTLIDSLNKIGVDSSYRHRCDIAAKNGIEGYIGSAEQNLYMLDLLNAGKLLQA